jgi:hypothetical protein
MSRHRQHDRLRPKSAANIRHRRCGPNGEVSLQTTMEFSVLASSSYQTFQLVKAPVAQL